MQKESTIAILIATYNGEKYLKEQLDSIFTQSYQNFKLYISDDCSVDSTVEIIKEYQQRFPNKIFFSINEQNIGYVKNFEKLLQHSSERYIAFSDQDDIWHTEKLKIQLEALIDLEKKYPSKPCLIHHDLEMVNEEGSTIFNSFFKYRKINLLNRRILNKIISHNGVMGNTVLMNTQLKEIVLPFPKELDVQDYWIAIVNEIFGQRKTINKCLIKYRIHNTNSSNNSYKLKGKKRMFLSTIFNKDKLPFRGLNRENTLTFLIKNYSVEEEDTRIIKAFIQYLKLQDNPFKIIYECIKYDFFRTDIRYKIKIFIKIFIEKIK